MSQFDDKDSDESVGEGTDSSASWVDSEDNDSSASWVDSELRDSIESSVAFDENVPVDSKGFTFGEAGKFQASKMSVICCDFSSDGKLLATGGCDGKVVLLHADSLTPKASFEEHEFMISDVRFSPSMQHLATSSFDRTVRLWDVDNPSHSLRTFTGHCASVMSLDFHPIKDDLIGSCDGYGKIRFWSINKNSCTKIFKSAFITGCSNHLRFQPLVGKFLAASSSNVVSVFDVETQALQHSLQDHLKPVQSFCWDPSGELLATVSADSVRVWRFGSGDEGECVHELISDGKKFCSCVFHPVYPTLLIIGCDQTLELWNMPENKSMTLPAHEGLIAAMAVSDVTGLVASVSYDTFVKVWK